MDNELTINGVLYRKVKCPEFRDVKPGEHFEHQGVEWVALDVVDGADGSGKGLLAVTAKCLPDEQAFDDDNCNNWATSSLRQFLNGEYLDDMDADILLPHVVDLIADNGDTAYGTTTDKVFLLSCDEYRKYRKFMPRYDEWVWTCTPWSCGTPYAGTARGVRVVHPTGTLYSLNAYGSGGVAPACVFRI